MDTGVYAAGSALLAHMRAQEVTAHNLANINTPGFKRRLTVFQPFDAHLAAEMAGDGTKSMEIDFARGPIDSTGNPLDMALDCEGFFVLEAADGDGYLYTRKGNFTLDGSGAIVDSVGRHLLGDGGGTLTVPAETNAIRVDHEGRVFADGSAIGRVWVVDVADRRALAPAAGTAFGLPEGGPAPKSVERPAVVQGALEGANVNPVDELVTMIATLRSFEAAQRTLTAFDDTTEQLTKAAQNTSS